MYYGELCNNNINIFEYSNNKAQFIGFTDDLPPDYLNFSDFIKILDDNYKVRTLYKINNINFQ